MALRINTNVSALKAQRAIAENDRKVQNSLEELSSGKRITSSGTNAAATSSTSHFHALIRSTEQAARNAEIGGSFVQVAEGSLSEISNHLVRMRELAIQSASDTVGDAEREFLDAEFQGLKDDIDRVASVTNFNGIPLLNGQAPKDVMEFQVGVHGTENDRIQFRAQDHDVRTTEIGVSGLQIRSDSNALDSLDSIDSALGKVNLSRARLGALGHRLDSAQSVLDETKVHLEAARSSHEDTDYAVASSDFIKARILQEAAVSVLSQANFSKQNINRLIAG